MNRAETLSLLHVITGLDVGGAERAMARVVEFAHHEGVRSSVVSLGRGGRVAEALRRQGTPVVELAVPRGRISPAALWRLRRLVMEQRPTHVHGWMYHGNLAAAFAVRRLADRPALAWNVRQSLDDIRGERPLTRAVIRANALLSRWPDGIVYNSARSCAQHSEFGFARARAEIIPNGFDLAGFARGESLRAGCRAELGIGEDTVLVCCVARYHPVKNHRALLEAVAGARRECPGVRLLLIGAGLDHSNPELAALVERLQLGEVVRLAGERDDVAAWLAAADLFCLPSLSEAFPNAVGEAMASGLPCVVSDVGDVTELVGDCGWIVPKGDTPSLRRALVAAVTSSAETRAALGRKARQRVADRYSIRRVGELYLDFYRRIARTASRPAS